MAEVRKRNSKTTTRPSLTTYQTQGPRGNSYSLYLILGVVSLAVIYFYLSSSASDPSSIPTQPTSNTPSTKPSHTPSPSTPNQELELTDAQLLTYTGTDPTLPIYVAINGTIFDVTSGGSFYGPGGHYSHFAGRDATRAWVSTCFAPEYLIWDMKGVEKMFMPRWMDEEVQDAADGVNDGGGIGGALREQAAKALGKVRRVSKEERRERRVEDRREAEKGVEESLRHWVDFFRNSGKYKEVGRVVGRRELDEERDDPGLCEEAMKKRPVKGGRFGKLMDAAMGPGPVIMGGDVEAGEREVPDFVKAGKIV